MTRRDDRADTDRRSGIAAWRRIADTLEAEIGRGQPRPGAQLATEAALAQRFGVNRHTIRRALAALAEAGTVRAERGRGTFVAHGRLAYPIGPRTRFTEIVAGGGHEAGAELIDHHVIEADPVIASRLGIAAGTPVLQLRLKRFVDGVPISIGTTVLPLPRFERFAEAFARYKAVTPALAACGVTDYRRLETRISARLATGVEAVALGLGSGRVLLAADSVNVDPEGRPIQATQALFAADRLELVIASDTTPARGR